jgi:hypothetical protein
MIKSPGILHRMKNFSDKSCRESQNIHFMFNSFSSENCTVFETMWENSVELDRPQIAAAQKDMGCECQITTERIKAHTHSY